jgi:hypothetical protein
MNILYLEMRLLSREKISRIRILNYISELFKLCFNGAIPIIYVRIIYLKTQMEVYNEKLFG